MALRRIIPRRRPLLPVPRALFSSNPPFPPPPPPTGPDPDAAHSPSNPAPNPGAPRNPASIFGDIRERLRASPPPRRTPMSPPRPNFERGATNAPSLSDISQMLNNFRGGAPSPSGTTPSFVDLIKQKPAPPPSAGQSARAGFESITGLSARAGFESIRESLKGIRIPQQQKPSRSPSSFLSPMSPIFDKERERSDKAEDKDSAFKLTRNYTYEDLGKMLGELRPAGAAKDGKEGFSLEELQGRIAKLVELEKQQDGQFADVRMSLTNAFNPKSQNQNKPGFDNKKLVFGNIQTLLSLGQNKEYLRLPPQEELVERYFHPDHMSSEEKMKLELQRVRDEFKMSENDCGSARVQIAQLTLKIKHLSAVLHKKDKHSRKGLQEMVQRRKKYLKYLRRTDWDSYCLVLSKLGLRDVPEYKAPDYKSKPTTKAKSKKSKGKKKRKMKA
ncbi:hypothetical protein BS78_04G309400 [Paspalum vaginatum]|nr:hypothetical protein BS78_04G309400 [Paspalum vaginatum]